MTDDALLRLAGAYIAWELHLGSHYCPLVAGEGDCQPGGEILRRLHTAEFALDDEQRAAALAAVRTWDWEIEAPYPEGT